MQIHHLKRGSSGLQRRGRDAKERPEGLYMEMIDLEKLHYNSSANRALQQKKKIQVDGAARSAVDLHMADLLPIGEEKE